MEPSARVCPAVETLEAYAIGHLDEFPAQRIENHLATCSRCRKLVDEAPPDSLLARLRQSQGGGQKPKKHPSFPALYDVKTKLLHPLSDVDSFEVGRNETANLPIRDLNCSRHQFKIVQVAKQYHVVPLSREQNPTFRNNKPVTTKQLLQHNDCLTGSGFELRFLARPLSEERQEPPDITPGRQGAPEYPETELSSPEQGDILQLDHSIPVKGKMVIGRERHRVRIYLPHPHVSRKHARLSVQGKEAILEDLDSANGTFVNGRRIARPTRIRPNDQIDIGPYSLRFNGSELQPHSRSNNIELVARNLRRTVTSRETGRLINLLDDLSLVIRPKEFVCILGPSGSGKSTLLSALSGRLLPEEGAVPINGQDLYASFDAIKQDIAVVPQKDLLHESLKVRQALWYTARLRLPPDTSSQETEECIEDILQTVQLESRRDTGIRYLSGGQVKRASLANEILCQPTLIFLDEVTSGLDEQTDREMMKLFQKLALAGKTVVCITHSLANVESSCNLVVILAQGGRLAFVGQPSEALEYFNGIKRLGDVYELLDTKSPEHWQQTFRASSFWKKYVEERMPKVKTATPSSPGQRSFGWKEKFALFFRQTSLLTRRYLAIWCGDPLSLLALAGQSLVVALLLGLLFGDLTKVTPEPVQALRTVNLFFLLAVSSFWFGCNCSAKEIVKERTIAVRERDFNVLVSSYYTSKLLVLLLFSSVQTLLLFCIVLSACGPPGDYPLLECGLLLALTAAGVTLGLTLSALAPTEEMAVTLIPLWIIPQIILSGIIAPLEGLSKTLAQALITTYWGNRGLNGLLPDNVAKAGDLFPQPSAGLALLVVLGHCAFFMIVALLILWLQKWRVKGVAGLFRKPVRSAA
jgi:ABC-type multidrug transport system ATPase subunit